ncbi:MAG: hypothetical protein IPL40_08780 [Proteobacteria bacterium]|nr:hypothetical protein [Pseudomonadota bacterium]
MKTTTGRRGVTMMAILGLALALVACGADEGGTDFGTPWDHGQGAPTGTSTGTPAGSDPAGVGGYDQALSPGGTLAGAQPGTQPGTPTQAGATPQDPFGGYTPTNAYTGTTTNPYGTQGGVTPTGAGAYGGGTASTAVYDDGTEYALRLNRVESGFEAALACNLWDARNLVIPATWALKIVPLVGFLWGSMTKLALVRNALYLRYGIALTDWGCDPRVQVAVGGKSATSEAFTGDAPNLVLLRGLKRGELLGKTIDVAVLDHDSIIVTEWDTTIARCTGTVTEAALTANVLTLSCSFPWPGGLGSVLSSETITNLVTQTGATPSADGSIVQVTFAFRP